MDYLERYDFLAREWIETRVMVGVMNDPYLKKEIKKQHAVSKMSQ